MQAPGWGTPGWGGPLGWQRVVGPWEPCPSPGQGDTGCGVAWPLRGHPPPPPPPVYPERARGDGAEPWSRSSADAQRQQQMSVMLQVWHGKDGQEVPEGCPKAGLVSPQHPPSWEWDPLVITHSGGGIPSVSPILVVGHLTTSAAPIVVVAPPKCSFRASCC